MPTPTGRGGGASVRVLEAMIFLGNPSSQFSVTQIRNATAVDGINALSETWTQQALDALVAAGVVTFAAGTYAITVA